jgi:hypothetical protein
MDDIKKAFGIPVEKEQATTSKPQTTTTSTSTSTTHPPTFFEKVKDTFTGHPHTTPTTTETIKTTTTTTVKEHHVAGTTTAAVQGTQQQIPPSGQSAPSVVLQGTPHQVQTEVVQPAIVHKIIEQPGVLRKEVYSVSQPQVHTETVRDVTWPSSVQKSQIISEGTSVPPFSSGSTYTSGTSPAYVSSSAPASSKAPVSGTSEPQVHKVTMSEMMSGKTEGQVPSKEPYTKEGYVCYPAGSTAPQTSAPTQSYAPSSATAAPGTMQGSKHAFECLPGSQKQEVIVTGKTATMHEEIVQPAVIRQVLEQPVLLRKDNYEVEQPPGPCPPSFSTGDVSGKKP